VTSPEEAFKELFSTIPRLDHDQVILDDLFEQLRRMIPWQEHTLHQARLAAVLAEAYSRAFLSRKSPA
jgi:hypothetical protein